MGQGGSGSTGSGGSQGLPLGSYAVAIGLAWTAALAVSLGWSFHQSRGTVLALARAEAEAIFRRDDAYRAWAAEKGGVYVPTSPTTPPNPYLAHVPERDLTTPSGRQLTLLNPAYLSRQVQEFVKERGSDRAHITSLRLLRPENAPDAWEAAALARLERGETTVQSVETIGGEPYLRWMGRLVAEERCLRCHGAQGYRPGDVRGGVSVSLPLAPFLAIERQREGPLVVGHAAVWLLGVMGLGFTSRRLAARVRERDRAEAALRETEAEKARLEGQLAQARKLEALGQLAGGVAHDFNNLLTPILGISGMVADELPKEHPLRDDLREIRVAAERARDLTRRLLAFGRQQQLDPQPLDACEVVASLDPMLRRLIGEHVEIATALRPVPPVRADRSQLETALVNLVVNARDAMPGGGHLVVALSEVALAPADAARLEVPPGDYVELTVADDGAGMDAETLSRAFEPFFTTKPEGRGTGLGLAMVHGVVKQHGGAIELRSAPRSGTTARILLPGLRGPLATARRPEGPVPRGSETVLVAEDDAGVRGFICTALAALGYAVLVARDGHDALRIGKERAGPIHLLVSDVVMPRMSGRELFERLSADGLVERVLFVSGYTRDVFSTPNSQGAALVLQKPFSLQELAEAVRATLDRAASVRVAARR